MQFWILSGCYCVFTISLEFLGMRIHIQAFLERFQNCENCLLASLCLSIRLHGTSRFPLHGILRNSIFEDFFEILSIKYFWSKSENNNLYLHEDVCTFVITFRSALFRKCKFSAKIVQKIKPYVLYSRTLSQKSCRLWDNVKKIL